MHLDKCWRMNEPRALHTCCYIFMYAVGVDGASDAPTLKTAVLPFTIMVIWLRPAGIVTLFP
jgi:hypothetical protein